jgi:transcriptional regulator with XRE-family HTH domain
MQPPGRPEVNRAFARTLRELREKARISQEKLALEAGVARRYMSGLEQGEHNPTLNLVYRLLGPLKISFVAFAHHLDTHVKTDKKRDS